MVTPHTNLIPRIYSSSVLNSPSKTPSGYVACLKVPTRLSKLVRSNGCNVNKIGNGKYLTRQIRIAWAVPQKSNMTRATENVIYQFGNETIELRLLLEILHMVSSGLVQDNQVLKMWGNSLPIRCAILDNVLQIPVGEFGIEQTKCSMSRVDYECLNIRIGP